MIKNKDIIIVGIQPWDVEIGSNCKNIAIELAKHNRVLYVNSPLDRISRYRERHTDKIKKRVRVKKGLDPYLVEIDNNFWNLYPPTITESINWIKSQKLFEKLNLINSKRFASDILMAVKELNFSNYILFNDSSMFLGLHLKKLLHPTISVYYIRDFLIKNPYWRKHGLIIEPKLIAISDLVVNNSTLYTEYAAKYNKHSYMVGQGCDTTLFNDKEREIKTADDLSDIPRPIIGYVGFLSSRRLSIEIITHIAKAKPNWSIVLIGPEDDQFKSSELHNMNNVYFLGSRDSSVLPNYIKGFDIAMNPQLINDATIGNYPRKIDEYLVMGKPILASSTKAMEYFKDYTYLGKTAKEYLQLAEKALAENTPEKEEERRLFGSSHSWKNNVEEILKRLVEVANEKKIEL